MKTITYNPETHVLVPREPSVLMAETGWDDAVEYEAENVDIYDIAAIYRAMIAVAPQPEPNPNWCAGCSPDNCSGCGTFYEIKKQRDELLAALGSGGRHCNDDTPHSDLCEAIIDSKEADLGQGLDPFWKWAFRRRFHEAETSYKVDIATLEQQRDELMAALKVERDGIDKFLVANDPTEFDCACDLSVGYLCGPCHADKQQQEMADEVAKINEVLKP